MDATVLHDNDATSHEGPTCTPCLHVIVFQPHRIARLVWPDSLLKFLLVHNGSSLITQTILCDNHNDTNSSPNAIHARTAPSPGALHMDWTVRTMRLEPDQIRLIHLNPHNEYRRLLSVNCTLHTFDLQHAPAFRALSYTCGPAYRRVHRTNNKIIIEPDEEKPVTTNRYITCNDQVVAVSQNLHDALAQFTASEVIGWLWVDALCIRQDDLVERAAQVQRMDRIYSQAYEVLIWLGRAFFTDRDPLYFIREFEPALAKVPLPKDGKLARMSRTILDTSWHHELAIDEFLPRLHAVIIFFAACRYFWRVWTIQELALSKAARIFVGEDQLPYAIFETFVSWINTLDWATYLNEDLRERFDFQATDWFSALRQGQLVRRLACDSTNLDLSLFSTRPVNDYSTKTGSSYWWLILRILLSMTSRTLCLDPQDNIYALMGVASKIAKMSASPLQLDYSQSTTTLYIQVTKRLLEENQCLALMADFATFPDTAESGRPSWVPDYSVRRKPTSIVMAEYALEGRRTYTAAMGLDTQGKFMTVDCAQLNCQGILFDVVTETTLPNLKNEGFPIIKTLLFGLAKSSTTRGQGRGTLDALWRTLVQNLLVTLQGVTTAMMEDSFFRYFMAKSTLHYFSATARSTQTLLEAKAGCRHFIIRVLDLAPEPPDVLTELCDLIITHVDQAETWDDLMQGIRQIHNDNIPKMFLFVTTYHRILDGHQVFLSQRGLIGLAGQHVKAGDQIWIAAGAYTPLALRPTGTELKFRFTGDIFMLDHMHGEILKDDNCGLDGKEQDFCIV